MGAQGARDGNRDPRRLRALRRADRHRRQRRDLGDGQPAQEGYSQTTQLVATNDNYLTPAATLSNPFPNGIVRPAGSSAGTGTFLGQQITFFDPHAQHPYNMRWNFGIQRQLPGQMVLEVVYIGNHGVHLPITTQLDFIPRQYLSASPTRDQTAINLLSGAVANPFKGLLPNSSSLNGSTVPFDQLLIPFPQYPVPGPPTSTSNGVVRWARRPAAPISRASTCGCSGSPTGLR